MTNSLFFGAALATMRRKSWQLDPVMEVPVHDRAMSGSLLLRLSDGTLIVESAALDVITTYVLLEQETWFEKEVPFVLDWVQPGMTVIDIGANVGLFSLPIARRVGPAGQVFAFEPGSEARGLLEKGREHNCVWNL